MKKSTERNSESMDAIKRAFVEFLTLPSLIIIGFLLLALATYALDRSDLVWLLPARTLLKAHVFADAKATSDLLSAIAAGIISVTSLTITLLLIVVQQSAASMTAQVFDQFLRRKTNQVYFGFFVGLALYSLITLATVNDPFNPVWGGFVAFILTVIALYLLVLLMYTTINQMRPVEIIEAIHDHILTSREKQLALIKRTRRTSQFKGAFQRSIYCDKHGYVANINIENLDDSLSKITAEYEVVLLLSIGGFIAYGDVLAEVTVNDRESEESIVKAILSAVHIDRQRDIDFDTAYGIEQLETIAWTSISTAKSNPAPGLLTIRCLRNILARWAAAPPLVYSKQLPIVYVDNTSDKLMDAFETLAIASSESMQHQNFIEILHSITLLFDRMSTQLQQRTEDLLLRILSALGDHVLTFELEKALYAVSKKMEQSGKREVAQAIEKATEQLAQSVGKLNSRSTRATAYKD
ncbi:MAG: DUF2254 family protein [Chitinophagaceae bacterium]